MDIQWIYGIKIISCRLGGRHTQPLATMPFIPARVSLQQQRGCAIDLESLEIRQRQKRLFSLDTSENLYERGIFLRFHRLHWVWHLVQVESDLSKETCEEQEVEMDIKWIHGIKIISCRLGGRHAQPLATMCVWRPPSLHEIILIPYDVHLHFLLFTCFFWKICSRSYSSKHAA